MSSNPLLQDKHLQEMPPPQPGTELFDSPPLAGSRSDRFTIDGTIAKTFGLLAILAVAGFVGWNTVDAPVEFEPVKLPGWIFAALIGGLVTIVLAYMKPQLAKYLAPLYAVVEGLLVGAISHVYEIEFSGIVLQAVVATMGVFLSMLLLYTSRTIRVTPKLRRGVMIATGGIMAVYLFQIAMRVFGADLEVPFLHDSGPVGILISLAIIGVAAFNFLVDFDFIEKSEKAGLPAEMEWTAALGLLVTLIWLYLEMLRLLAKLRD